MSFRFVTQSSTGSYMFLPATAIFFPVFLSLRQATFILAFMLLADQIVRKQCEAGSNIGTNEQCYSVRTGTGRNNVFITHIAKHFCHENHEQVERGGMDRRNQTKVMVFEERIVISLLV